MFKHFSLSLLILAGSFSVSYGQFTTLYQGTNLCPGVSGRSNTSTVLTITTSGTKPTAGTYYVTLQYRNPSTFQYTSFTRRTATIATTGTGFTITFAMASMPSTLISSEVPLLIDIDAQSSASPYEYYLYYLNGGPAGACSVILPVTLVSFTSTTVGNYNKLEWVTSSESNSDYYEVQRSTDGTNWTANGYEPAAGTSTSNITYTFYTPRANSGTTYYYRLKQADLDGTNTYSSVISRAGSGTGNPTDFCSYFTIDGPASFCGDATSGVYKLHNIPGAAWWSTTWSASPTNVGISYYSYGGRGIATVSKTGSGSTTTLSVSSGGCTKTKTINIVAPSVSIQTSYSIDYPTHTTYYVYASPSPAGSGTNFRWYKNGSYYGTFSSDTIAVTSSEGSSNWSVVASTACGDVTGSTTLYYHSFFGMRYVLSPVPANNLLTISSNPNYTSSNVKEKETLIDNKYLIQIVDMFGNLKKEIKNVSLGKSYQIDVSSLQSGNYIIHIINGNDRFSSQVRITK